MVKFVNKRSQTDMSSLLDIYIYRYTHTYKYAHVYTYIEYTGTHISYVLHMYYVCLSNPLNT